MTNKVAFLACDSYEKNLVYEKLKRLTEYIPPENVAGKTVLIKPNLLLPKKPESAVCTHPSVTAAAVRVFLDLGAARVIVGESPAVSDSLSTAKFTGTYDAITEAGGEWVSFVHGTDVQCPEGKLIKKCTFASVFAEADIVVSVAKLKTHQLMAYTGAMKNLFGLMVGLDKAQSHFRFPERENFSAFLTDIIVAAKPSYAIMDAVTAMDGKGGPGNGNPVDVHVLAASDNILALDCACAKLVGYDPLKIGNLWDALERNIWLRSVDDIEYVADDFTSLKPKKFEIVKSTRASALLKPYMPKFIHDIATWICTRYPIFTTSCKLCGECVKICPAQALSVKRKVYIKAQRCLGCGNCKEECPSAKPIEEKKIILDAKKCLHCYCCHEICSHNAIKLKRLFIG
ncbi:MAG: DUF362 domain-containing protein [Spirochaetales bacterium]